MVAGGYVTAKLAPNFEIKNVIALGTLNFALSMLIVTISLISAQQKVELSSLFYGICISVFFSYAASLLGGGLRLIEKKKREG